jgi:hypothetical protein
MTEERAYDLVVGGGGYAGVFAAVAAAREFRRMQHDGTVALVQDRPVLGGCGSSEVRVPPIGAGRHPWAYETGLIHEYMLEERRRNHTAWDYGLANSVADLVLWEMVRAEGNLDLFLNTSIRDAHAEDRGDARRIVTVTGSQLGSERELALRGRIFIDATGDATIGTKAGANSWMGREGRDVYGEPSAPASSDDQCMGSTLLFKAVDVGKPAPFDPPEYAATFPTEASLAGRPLVDFGNGYWWIEVGVPYNTLHDNELVRDELIRQVLGVWDHIKNRNPRVRDAARTWALDWFGWLPGKRETRRLAGDHVLVEQEVRERTRFYDRVAYGGHFLDLHTMGGILAAAQGEPGNPVDIDPGVMDRMRVAPYAIPMRSLYSRNITNLMMAGRDISASHVAIGSARVMLTTSVIGQAAGTAAAYCVVNGVTPREAATEAHVGNVQQSLLRQGCYIPHLANADPLDLARSATVTVSSEATLDLAPADTDERWRSMETDLGLVVPISEDWINAVSLWLRHDGTEPVELELALYPIADLWSAWQPASPIAKSASTVQPGSNGWVEFVLNAAVEPQRLYRFAVTKAPGAFWRYTRELPTGVTGLWRQADNKPWLYADEGRKRPFQALHAQLHPRCKPYGARNVINGVTRPESWPNLWISDPSAGLPQHVQLTWPEPIDFTQVELTFDTNLSKPNERIEPLTVPPEAVRDYRIQVHERGTWTDLLTVHGNTQRQRRHTLTRTTSDALRLVVDATNGDPSARLYEMRVYE